MTPLTLRAGEEFQPPVTERHLEAEVAHCVGGVISPLLANIALHVLNEAWQDEGRRLGVLVRYCDDFVVLSPTRERAEQDQQLAARVLGLLGMRLHPENDGGLRKLHAGGHLRRNLCGFKTSLTCWLQEILDGVR